MSSANIAVAVLLGFLFALFFALAIDALPPQDDCARLDVCPSYTYPKETP